MKARLPLVLLSKDRRERRVQTGLGAAMVFPEQKVELALEGTLEAQEQKVRLYSSFIVL